MSLHISLDNADTLPSFFLYLTVAACGRSARDCFLTLLTFTRISMDVGYPCMSFF